MVEPLPLELPDPWVFSVRAVKLVEDDPVGEVGPSADSSSSFVSVGTTVSSDDDSGSAATTSSGVVCVESISDVGYRVGVVGLGVGTDEVLRTVALLGRGRGFPVVGVSFGGM